MPLFQLIRHGARKRRLNGRATAKLQQRLASWLAKRANGQIGYLQCGQLADNLRTTFTDSRRVNNQPSVRTATIVIDRTKHGVVGLSSIQGELRFDCLKHRRWAEVGKDSHLVSSVTQHLLPIPTSFHDSPPCLPPSRSPLGPSASPPSGTTTTVRFAVPFHVFQRVLTSQLFSRRGLQAWRIPSLQGRLHRQGMGRYPLQDPYLGYPRGTRCRARRS